MHSKNISYLLMAVGCAVLTTLAIFFLLPVQPVSAQCGSQASSCKNCHETQAMDPVNNDGTTWHTEHAFGDFCYLCHAGNNQASDETAAHTGMVDPLADIVTSCKSCHAADFQAKAQIYATSLGVSLDTSASAAPVATAAADSAAPQATLAPVVSASTANVPAGTLVDYSQRYDESVLGQKPVNVGNVILIIMIAGFLFGGGFFILRREHWLKISFEETKVIEGSYPADVVDMVPELARLDPSARKDLRLLLARPNVAAELFALVKKLTSHAEVPDAQAGPADSEDGKLEE